MNRKLKTGLVALFLLASITAAASKPKIYLKSGTLSPEKSVGSGSSTADIKQKTQYKVLQFREPTTEAYRNKLADKGLTFHFYIPENAWIVDLNGVNRGEIVRKEKVWFIGPYKASYKIDSSLKKFSKPGKRLNVSVEAFRPATEDFKARLEKYGDIVNKISGSNWEVSTIPENISKIAGLSSVKIVSPGIGRPTTMNAVSRKIIDVERLHSSPFNLQGEGFTAAVWDAGWAGLHEDLNYTGKRVIGDKGCSEAYCTVGDHPTHVSGTLLGGGKKKYKYRGMAPKARLATYEWPTSGSSELYSETNESINKYNSVLSQNSWGFKPTDCDSAPSVYGNYPSWSRYYDKILGSKSSEVEGTLSVIFSAGNAQGNCGLTYNTTTYPSTAKNVITVGAVDDNVTDQGSDITSFSSLGPTDDGRIKPDVVANGLGVTSAVPDKFIDNYYYDCDNNGDDFCYPYDVMSGTSMAAPAVSGAVVLVNQKYNRTFGDKPAPATVKGLLVHNAEDINRTGPDYVTGWGVVNTTQTINYIGQAYQEKLIKRGTVDQGGNASYTVNMSTGSSANFTLVWSDYPASAGASKTLVNDLDLVIRNSTGHRYYPWTLNWSIRKQKAVRTKEDHRNNVVQVHIPNVTSEKLHISVNGTTVPKGPQSYTLLMSEKVQLVPELKIKSPLNKSYRYTPDFNLSSSSPLESAKFSVNGGANFSMANKSEELFYNTTTQLQEGEHKVTFYAEYEEGKWTSTSQKFKIDKTKPQLDVKKPSEGENLSNSVNINATWSDLLSDINSSEAYISNKSGIVLKQELNFTFNSEKLEDGKYNITYNVTDKAGNYNSSIISVTIDNTPPELSYYSPKEEALSGNFTINASYKDATTAVKSAEYLLTNSTGLQKSGVLNATLNSSELENGDYTLSYRIKDYAENLKEKNVTVTVDNRKPTLNVLAPENGSFAPRNFWVNATWNGTFSAAVEANFTVYNGTYNQSGKLNSTVNTENMQEGLYNITYAVKDGAGNTVSRRINTTLDKTRPSLNLISPDPSSIQSGNFSINASYHDDLSGIGSAKYYIKNSSAVQRSGGLNATVNSSKLAGGSYTLKLKVNDTAGNTADTSIDFKIDNSAPDIISKTLNPGMNVTGLIDINITVSDVSGLDTARFRWYNSSGYVTAWKDFNYTDFDTASLETGSYNVSVQLNDSLGHVRVENISGIAVDNTAPVLELKEYNLTQKYRGWIKDYKKVRVSCMDQGTGSQNISFFRESRINSSSATSANFTAEAHGNHSYTFKCTDYVGNTGSVQRRYSIDTETPQVTSVAPEEGSKTGRNVTVNADFQSEVSEAGLNESASSLQVSKGDLKNVEWSNSSFTAEIKSLDYSESFSLTGSIDDNLGHSHSVDLAYSVKSKPEGSSTSLPGGASNSTNTTNSSEPQTIFEKTEKGLEVHKIQLEEGKVETVNLSNYTSGIVSKVLLKGSSSGLVGLRASRLDESGFSEPLGTVANRYFRMEVLNPYRVEDVVLKFKVDSSWLEKQGLESGSVSLYRIEDGWNKISTSQVSEGLYRAELQHFSNFSIAAAKPCKSRTVFAVDPSGKACKQYSPACEKPGLWKTVDSCKVWKNKQKAKEVLEDLREQSVSQEKIEEVRQEIQEGNYTGAVKMARQIRQDKGSGGGLLMPAVIVLFMIALTGVGGYAGYIYYRRRELEEEINELGEELAQQADEQEVNKHKEAVDKLIQAKQALDMDEYDKAEDKLEQYKKQADNRGLNN